MIIIAFLDPGENTNFEWVSLTYFFSWFLIICFYYYIFVFPLQPMSKLWTWKPWTPIRPWGLHLCKLKSVYQNDDLHHVYMRPHYWFFIIFPIAVYVKCKKQWEDLKEQSNLSATVRWTTAILDIRYQGAFVLFPLLLCTDFIFTITIINIW